MQLSKIYFMLRKLQGDMQSLWRQPVETCISNKEALSHYYLVFESDPSKLNKLITDFDKNGVPMNASYVDVEEEGLHYYPISIGQYALAVFHDWIDTQDIEYKDQFLRIADWFVEHRTEDDRTGTYWLTDIPKPEYNVYLPWKSAFSQSRAISVLLRAWQLTGNDNYKKIAGDALIPFSLDITEGGVSVDRSDGKTFYEEYVATRPTRVLDGHIFSLFGLQDYIRAVTQETDHANHNFAKKLFEEGVEGLKAWLPEYDLGYWVRFNYCDLPDYPQFDPCTIGYLKLVSLQLRIMYNISGDIAFKKYANEFESYLNPVNIIRMYRQKARALKKLNRL